jgi:hypothetical protein
VVEQLVGLFACLLASYSGMTRRLKLGPSKPKRLKGDD